MSETPSALARAVVLDGLKNDTPLFVALQYLGLVQQERLLMEFKNELDDDVAIVEAHGFVASETPVRIPREYARVPPTRQAISLFKPNPDGTISYHGPRTTPERSKFSQWMEKEIAWSPDVFGWDEDSPEAELMRREAAGER